MTNQFKIAEMLASFFYIGKIGKCPGTFGSIATYPLFISVILLTSGNNLIASLTITTCLIFAIGIWSSKKHCQTLNKADPGEIVIDEVAGQFMTLSCMLPSFKMFEISQVILFTLPLISFRLFDIIKPWPIKWFDQNVKGAFGIMIDDIIAAIMAVIFSYALLFMIE